MPREEVVAVIGDGGYQMTIQELGTVFQTKAAVKIVVLNNDFLGMVSNGSNYFLIKDMHQQKCLIDFIKIAKGYYIKCKRVEKRSELADAVEQMIKSKDPFF